MTKVTIYTDGAARGNPNGPGGYGVVLLYTDSKGVEHIKELSAGYEKTTNNRMELIAAIKGLETLISPSEVDLYSDSQYLVRAFNDNWINNWVKNKWKKSDGSDVKNPDLWKILIELTKIHSVKFIWVKGHNNNKYNDRCDKLATTAADNNAVLKDIC